MIVDLIVDYTIDMVIETLIRMCTIEKQFDIIKYYYMYLNKRDYTISHTIESNLSETLNYQSNKYLIANYQKKKRYFIPLWEYIKSMIDNKAWDFM